ncbi:MAG: peptidoglycan-binding domain-containing protein [Candidatus Nanopelagicales bacterium]
MFNLRVAAAGAAVILAVGGLAGCSSSSSTPSTSPSETMTSASASPSSSGGGENIVALDKEIQTNLNAVGCQAGPVDGILGPETDQAIVRFQEADGLEVNGEAGPETILALKKASVAGRTVCSTATASPTSTPSPTSTTAPCTATALAASLPSDAQLQSFVCVNVAAERWAAGQYMSGPSVQNFFAKADGSTWKSVSKDQVCGTASAGLPPKLLDYCGMT